MMTLKLSSQWQGSVEYQSMAGLVYTGEEDLVFCYSKLDRQPLLSHKEESTTYSFTGKRLRAVKGEGVKTKSPSKSLNPELTSSIGQLISCNPIVSKSIHTVMTALNKLPLSYRNHCDDHQRGYLPSHQRITNLKQKELNQFYSVSNVALNIVTGTKLMFH